jgi:PIN domain nuclease of toxin-antitoxin system
VSQYLLDTHTLLWFDNEPEYIPPSTLHIIRNNKNTIYVSSMSIWELSIKFHLGKLPTAKDLLKDYKTSLSAYSFTELPFTGTHANLAGSLDTKHKDPFDRAIAAQAIHDNLILISIDDVFKNIKKLKVLW